MSLCPLLYFEKGKWVRRRLAMMVGLTTEFKTNDRASPDIKTSLPGKTSDDIIKQKRKKNLLLIVVVLT